LLYKKFKNIIIAGDININVLENSYEHKALTDTINAHGVKYLVDFPTRININSESAIDNFFYKFS